VFETFAPGPGAPQPPAAAAQAQGLSALGASETVAAAAQAQAIDPQVTEAQVTEAQATEVQATEAQATEAQATEQPPGAALAVAPPPAKPARPAARPPPQTGEQVSPETLAYVQSVLEHEQAGAPARPRPALRAEVNGLLDQAAAQVARQQQLLPSANPLLLLPEILRNAFASLALALGFAGLAQRPGRELSLLVELQIAWDRWRLRLAPPRRKAGRGTGSAAYLHQISDRNPDRG
jgi:hypothetical protein